MSLQEVEAMPPKVVPPRVQLKHPLHKLTPVLVAGVGAGGRRAQAATAKGAAIGSEQLVAQQESVGGPGRR